MEFKVSSGTSANPIMKIISDRSNFTINDLISTKGVLNAKVLERSIGNNEYLLNFSGRKLKLFSETKLLSGEEIKLKANREGSQIQLEILSRSVTTKESTSELDVTQVWNRNYFSPLKTLYSAMEQNQGEVSSQKIYQFLDVFFPGIEWNESVSQFHWKFQDGEANGYYGKKEDSFGFYFHFESFHVGTVDSYFHWKDDNFSDLVLHCVFDRLSTYLLANENLLELKKMLSSNSIFTNDIIFHYSSLHQDRGEWIA